jgi:glutaminyl-peptide cyclotransferase
LDSRLAVLLTLAVVACGGERSAPERFDVTARFPHDSSAYTQGLFWADSVLFESTGKYGRSDVRRVDLKTGRVLARHALGADRFGEGLALVGGRLYQLTWKEGVAYVYDPATLALVDSVRYPGEGWGLTTDGKSLIMSDGSDSLRFLEPSTFRVQRIVHARYNDQPIQQLNELEYVDGEVLSNVYQSNWIVRINSATGIVREILDLADLYPKRAGFAEVMNGISLAPDGKQLLLTGKMWPVLFEVRLKPLGDTLRP